MTTTINWDWTPEFTAYDDMLDFEIYLKGVVENGYQEAR